MEQRIVDLLPQGGARAAVVATELGVSPRTLIRQLAALGTSFSDLLDHLRKDLALKYVRETDLSLAQVAFLLRLRQPTRIHPGVQALDWQGAISLALSYFPLSGSRRGMWHYIYR